MVKKGGSKKKIPIEKIEKETSRRPCCSKRYSSKGLFGKASQLCLLSGGQIAILATPISENSNVSFYSFGHSSVDAVVSAFLSGKRPLFSPENNKPMREEMSICLTRKALGLGFWWEDEAYTTSQNPQELTDAVDSMSKLSKDAKQLQNLDDIDMDLDQLIDFGMTYCPMMGFLRQVLKAYYPMVFSKAPKSFRSLLLVFSLVLILMTTPWIQVCSLILNLLKMEIWCFRTEV
ncbi:unnamed protein product [Arabis nemorensis]|uniref:MADS-box domain-containing protein n=1 Tax=Arabis nemorensis TaxID=586526 RepID=A0A565CDA7_9BRAS|nr:unnamed protein product [Arabis nemorensis]